VKSVGLVKQAVGVERREVVVRDVELLERLVKSAERVAAHVDDAVVRRVEAHQSDQSVADDRLETVVRHVERREDRHLVQRERLDLRDLVVTQIHHLNTAHTLDLQ